MVSGLREAVTLYRLMSGDDQALKTIEYLALFGDGTVEKFEAWSQNKEISEEIMKKEDNKYVVYGRFKDVMT